jgi:hypothetical protein
VVTTRSGFSGIWRRPKVEADGDVPWFRDPTKLAELRKRGLPADATPMQAREWLFQPSSIDMSMTVTSHEGHAGAKDAGCLLRWERLIAAQCVSLLTLR